MTHAHDTTVDNRGERDYAAKVTRIADRLAGWQGPIVLLAHVDPDGDALGSCLALKRALEQLGKRVTLPIDPPRFLAFLAEPGELSEPLEALPPGCLLATLDVAERDRAVGAPLDGAELTINIDHHGTNNRFGDLTLVEPSKAATALIVKDIIDALGATWTVPLATPCLTGMLTDTGTFSYGNTTHEVLDAAGDLIDVGVPYAELTDRLKWRHPDYFRMLGLVMSTVEFPLGGLAATAHISRAMRAAIGETDDDSNDYVGLIRYAEGVRVAAFFKEREDGVKVSLRTREGVSAQRIAVGLGGGGHVAAAGAKLDGDLDAAKARVLDEIEVELRRQGLIEGRA